MVSVSTYNVVKRVHVARIIQPCPKVKVKPLVVNILCPFEGARRG